MEADVKRKEALRYLGYRGAQPDAKISALVDSCFERLETAADTRSRCREFAVERLEDGRLRIGTMEINSGKLKRSLEGCDSALLMAATLGTQVDALLRRSEVNNISDAVVMQAVAAVIIENYCDEVCAVQQEKLAERRLWLRPRFSPGYGDLELRFNDDILKLLEGFRIGVACTSAYMLTPVKSVTAIVGIGREKPCAQRGCAACAKTECLYRRD